MRRELLLIIYLVGSIYSSSLFLVSIFTFLFNTLYFLHLLVGSGNQNLNHLPGLDLLECFLCLFEANNARNQLLNINTATPDKLNGQLIISSSITERSSDRNLLDAHGHDGECDFVLAHAALHISASHTDGVNARLDRRLCAAGIDDGVGTDGEIRKLPDSFGVLFGRDSL